MNTMNIKEALEGNQELYEQDLIIRTKLMEFNTKNQVSYYRRSIQ
jgi:hypothetical protein